MNTNLHMFGGGWTEEKLTRVRKYMHAYAIIMNKRKYKFSYVDAFAGSGYIAKDDAGGDNLSFLPEILDDDARGFIEGSAKIALQVKPRFSTYIFIENNKHRCEELNQLRNEFNEISSDIYIIPEDANTYLQRLCAERDWSRERILVFLDPYGMEVDWETTAALAKTKAADVLILFPLGIAINRLLTKDGNIPLSWRTRLDRMFGTTDWYEHFYVTESVNSFFGEVMQTRKVADFSIIGQYYIGRLKTIFAGVTEKPLPLLNSKGIPLFLLCFATANPYAVDVTMKITSHILRQE